MAKNTPNAHQGGSISASEEAIRLLKQLGELKDAGVLTDDEFAQKKKELLEKLK